MTKENKFIKSLMESSVLVGISTGVGYIAKNMMKEPLISDPSSNLMNYGKWVAVMTGSIYLRYYLEMKKINPS